MSIARSVPTRRPHPAAPAIVALATILVAAACAEEDHTPLAPDAPSAAFAKGGNGGNNARILFQSTRDGGNDEIYTMNPDGSGVSRLTSSPAEDGLAAWSPDGKKVVFVSDASGDAEIYVMNADGTGVTRLTYAVGSDAFPRWSKDGKRIVFASSRDGASPVNPPLEDFEIYIMNADGTGVARLTNNSFIDIDPDWSPDGKRIAFVSSRDSNNGSTTDVYTMDVAGTNVTRLTNENTVIRLPFWAPGGKELVITRVNDIYKLNADGTGLTFLAGGHDELFGVWSDDGKQIAYGRFESTDYEVFVMNADGTGITRITFSPGEDVPTAWKR